MRIETDESAQRSTIDDSTALRKRLLGETQFWNPSNLIFGGVLFSALATAITLLVLLRGHGGIGTSAPLSPVALLSYAYFLLHPIGLLVLWLQPKIRWLKLYRTGVIADVLLAGRPAKELITIFSHSALWQVLSAGAGFIGIAMLGLVGTLSGFEEGLFFVFMFPLFILIPLIPASILPLYASEAIFWMRFSETKSFARALALAVLPMFLPSSIFFIGSVASAVGEIDGLIVTGCVAWAGFYSAGCYAAARFFFADAERHLASIFDIDRAA